MSDNIEISMRLNIKIVTEGIENNTQAVILKEFEKFVYGSNSNIYKK